MDGGKHRSGGRFRGLQTGGPHQSCRTAGRFHVQLHGSLQRSLSSRRRHGHTLHQLPGHLRRQGRSRACAPRRLAAELPSLLRRHLRARNGASLFSVPLLPGTGTPVRGVLPRPSEQDRPFLRASGSDARSDSAQSRMVRTFAGTARGLPSDRPVSRLLRPPRGNPRRAAFLVLLGHTQGRLSLLEGHRNSLPHRKLSHGAQAAPLARRRRSALRRAAPARRQETVFHHRRRARRERRHSRSRA